ncbi:MAG: hypothetical protein ACRD4G_01365 [Bryobacteraceae bacterium]
MPRQEDSEELRDDDQADADHDAAITLQRCVVDEFDRQVEEIDWVIVPGMAAPAHCRRKALMSGVARWGSCASPSFH